MQFGITDFTVTQYDASGFAQPIELRHTVEVPGPPPNSAVAQWDLGSELLGRSGCAEGPDGVHCAATMALAPEEPVNLSRTLTVPEPISVTPTVWVRPRQGPNLADLIRAPGTATATGDADPIDVLGSAYAAADGDPRTAWTAAQRVVQHGTPPNLTLKLPAAQEVGALRVAPSSSTLPAHPRLVAVDLGDGPQVRRLAADAGAQTLELRPKVTDTVKVSILDWDEIIDRTALGFDQLKPPGLAEVTALDPRGRPIAAADAARNSSAGGDAAVRQGTDHRRRGPVRADHDRHHGGCAARRRPRSAEPCQPGPIALPAGQQELIVSPGAAFVVDGIQLVGPRGRELPTAATSPVETGDVERRPPRGRRLRIAGIAHPCRPREHQSRLDRTHRRRHGIDPGNRQRLAAGLGAASGHVRRRHVVVRLQRRLPRRNRRRPCAAADPRAAWRSCRARRPPRESDPARPWQPNAVASGLAVVAVGRGDRGRRGHRRLLRGARCRLPTAQSRRAQRRRRRRHERGRADSGRRGAVPEPVAVGGRLRRALLGCPTAGADLGRRPSIGDVPQLNTARGADRHRRPRSDLDARTRFRALPRDPSQLSRGLGRRGQARGRRDRPPQRAQIPRRGQHRRPDRDRARPLHPAHRPHRRADRHQHRGGHRCLHLQRRADVLSLHRPGHAARRSGDDDRHVRPRHHRRHRGHRHQGGNPQVRHRRTGRHPRRRAGAAGGRAGAPPDRRADLDAHPRRHPPRARAAADLRPKRVSTCHAS